MAASLDVGRDFLTQVLAKIPAEARAAVQSAFEAAPDAMQDLGAGVLRQNEFSRRMDEVAAKDAEAEQFREQLANWHAEREAQLKILDGLYAQGVLGPDGKLKTPAAPGQPPTRPTPAPDLDTSDLVRKAEFDALQQNALGVIGLASTLPLKHYETFHEVLDFTALLAHPEATKLGIQGVYDKLYGAKYAEIAKTQREAEIAKAREEGRTEGLKAAMRQPFPTPHGADATTLDVLTAPPVNGQPVDKAQYSLEAIVGSYQDLVAAKAGGSSGSAT